MQSKLMHNIDSITFISRQGNIPSQTRFCKITIFLMNSELMPSCIIDIVVNDFVKPDFNETKHLGQENKMNIFFP